MWIHKAEVQLYWEDVEHAVIVGDGIATVLPRRFLVYEERETHFHETYTG